MNNNKALERLHYYWNYALLPQHVAASRRNVRRNPRELGKIQQQKLKRIIRHAYDHNLFYHRLYREKKVSPYDIKTVKDFSKIPIVDRRTIQKNSSQMLSVNIIQDQCYKIKTSGSSGIPLTVFIDRNTMLQRWTCSLRQFFECGGKWNYKQMEFRNKDDILTHNQRKIVNWALPKYVQVPINKLSPDVAASYLLKDRPEVVFGYPSFLLSLAETLLGKTDTKIVFVTGEILTSHYRKIIESKFCGNLIDTYGCTETGDIAWECPNEHAGYHMNVDSVFVEFIKEGENVSSGEEGEIVLTDLTNMAMPFIRYKIGDVGVPSNSLCSCGRTLPLMCALKGRSDDFVVLPSGKKISPLALLDLGTMNDILEFRVVQKNYCLLELWIKVQDNAIQENMEQFVSAMEQVVGENMEIQVHVVEKIPEDKSEKLRRIISEVDRV